MDSWMKIEKLSYKYERAVIINCGTLMCTTLAILSSLKYLHIPLLVIDCKGDNVEGDFIALNKLKQKYEFELVEMPLMSHGSLLDRLFLYLKSDYIYLVDSDVEILNEDACCVLRKVQASTLVSKENVFGYGFTQCAGLGLPPFERVFHMERMWIPLVCLNRHLIAKYIECGYSFNICSRSNFYYPKISSMLVKIRNKFNKSRIVVFGVFFDNVLSLFRKKHISKKIDKYDYDTGALLYEKMINDGLHYIGYNFYSYPYFCSHYCGVTRNKLYDNEPVSTSEQKIEVLIKTRLVEKFNFRYDDFYM